MMKEAAAVLMVVAGVAVAASAVSRDDERVALAIDRESLAADVTGDIRVDAALARLPSACAAPAARIRRAPVRRRPARRACAPRVTAAPDVARRISSDPTGSSRL